MNATQPDSPLQTHGDAPVAQDWRPSFRFDHIKVLIVCRGPIRLEAIEILERLGTQPCGILLSEKDSVLYPRALSPELRRVGRNERVHRIPDYTSASGGEKTQRIERILEIAREGRYTHLFAGYGFMAEDAEFIKAIENAGLGFIGPSSSVAEKAGAKDAAKALARQLGVSVTPGVDNLEALALVAKTPAGTSASSYLVGLARRQNFILPSNFTTLEPSVQAERVLTAAREKRVEIVSLADMQTEAQRQVGRLLREKPGRRFRLKHIAGGGGKGQRIVSREDEVPAAVFEVLNEVKATGPGSNKNCLIELNIESTRHNEIQLLGNGRWCIALGGRDCSLQMHEQKLVEVSITDEMLAAAAAEYQQRGLAAQAEVLRADREVLRNMEAQAEKFGAAVNLNSASTFESIVEGANHYFMEVNTRIQVEHRVTEMVYALRFTDPTEPTRSMVVESLVEAMVWMAVYGDTLPRPERIPRQGSGAEVRINATNDALKPHAGGIILAWSPPMEQELRDDQGIGLRNPDTGVFMPYQLAGAYDSNVALVVSHGSDRTETFEHLAEILRRSDMRGEDLNTNLGFHYGILHWMLGADPMVKPTTRFVSAYLAAVGSLRQAGRDLDLETAWNLMAQREQTLHPQAESLLETKRTLILRPLMQLYQRPHFMAGWLSPRRQRRFVIEEGRVEWRQNPLEVLFQLYHYLRLEPHSGVSPEEQIWQQDLELLNTGLEFYRDLRARLGSAPLPWKTLTALMAQASPPPELEGKNWDAIRAAHRGHQLGLSLLELPLLTGREAGFYDIKLNDRLEVLMPSKFETPASANLLRTALEDLPQAQSNEVVAFTGGTFYTRPSPADPPFVKEGDPVIPGQVLGLLEVMKMFNPLKAEFAGTITKVHLRSETGQMVHKGQHLFEIEPDTPIVTEAEEVRQARRTEKTRTLVDLMNPVGEV
ncbi:MAG: biotin carboxylase [Deltaproteobacteria bacterium]|nr:biotin carboxylase [Deltaproteobacteria bacterium]